MDHLIEKSVLPSFRSQVYLDKKVSCECLRCLKESLYSRTSRMRPPKMSSLGGRLSERGPCWSYLASSHLREVRNKENFKLLALKVITVTDNRWLLTLKRFEIIIVIWLGNFCYFGKLAAEGRGGHFREEVVMGGLTVVKLS